MNIRKGRLIYFLILIFSFVLACSSPEVKKDDTTYIVDPVEDYREYEKEGFITEDIYRIVIVEPKGGAEKNPASVEKTAKRRALSSMQKHLMSCGKIINSNTRARLMNLIEDHGTLRETKKKYETRYVYLFDVEKQGLKVYLDSIAPAR